MSLAIREAGPDDCVGLLGLIAAHAAFEHGEATITQGDLDAILRASPPDIGILVAINQAMLVGYAAMTLDFSLWRGHRWAHLDSLFVHEEHRGRSIGRQLLAAAKSAAGALGADRIEWQTPIWNEPAIRFYRAQAGQTRDRFLECRAPRLPGPAHASTGGSRHPCQHRQEPPSRIAASTHTANAR
ncbi:GNAT superfamily N-acetyltransferase [Novosphingobium sp. SG751A]|nr:GNAT superfamily N-acetyltransferase [Novosphingobium sp. SG751A]